MNWIPIKRWNVKENTAYFRRLMWNLILTQTHSKKYIMSFTLPRQSTESKTWLPKHYQKHHLKEAGVAGCWLQLCVFAFSSFSYITFFGCYALLFSKLALLDKVLFSDFCQTGTKHSFFQILGWHFLLSVKFQAGIGWRGNRMHFSPVHISVFDSRQDHFDSLCLAIIQSSSASCVDTSYQSLLYSVCT